jgi:general secretion pathway protein I
MRAKLESGFSTLEVIAAVAIIGIALIPIAALQTQLARSQARLAKAHAESTAVHNAMALLRDINPMLTPEGQRRLDDSTTLTWTSAAVSGLRQSVNPPAFEVQLYRVSATINRPSAASTAIQLDLIGWRPASQRSGE